MLRVLNARERNEAFLQFIVFFVLTTALVVGAIYFDFRLPLTEIKHLREEVSAQEMQSQNQVRFVAKMEEAKLYLDSLNKTPASAKMLEFQLNDIIKQLTQLQQKDESVYGRMNATIVETFIELQQDRLALINANKEGRNINLLQSQLSECQRTLDNFRNASGGIIPQ
jgi:hypothetical protein